jgi:hypothetical protein
MAPGSRRGPAQKPDGAQLARLLRTGGERPGNCQNAKKRNELATSHFPLKASDRWKLAHRAPAVCDLDHPQWLEYPFSPGCDFYSGSWLRKNVPEQSEAVQAGLLRVWSHF